MILGADNQNKNLRAAANIKTSSTPKTRTANKYSATISSSKSAENPSTGRAQATVEHESRQNINDGSPDPVRGSMEGLDNSKSTYIQPNNRGYDNNSLQSARYADRSKTMPTVKGASFLFTNNKNNSIMDNYTRSSMSGSSSDRINKAVKLNRYF